MKYPAFFLLALVMAFSVEVRAQDVVASNNNNTGSCINPCEQYKIGIITPSKDIDYKITVIVPPKNIDPAMVINPCSSQSQVASAAPPVIIPSQEPNAFFKVPPFTIKNKYSH